MNRKVYVNNIAWKSTNDDLKTFLKSMGYVIDEVKIIMSAEDGRSRGFGFVTFRTEIDALRALKELEGFDYMGRDLHVAEAVDKRQGSGGGGGGRNDGGGGRNDGGGGGRSDGGGGGGGGGGYRRDAGATGDTGGGHKRDHHEGAGRRRGGSSEFEWD